MIWFNLICSVLIWLSCASKKPVTLSCFIPAMKHVFLFYHDSISVSFPLSLYLYSSSTPSIYLPCLLSLSFSFCLSLSLFPSLSLSFSLYVYICLSLSISLISNILHQPHPIILNDARRSHPPPHSLTICATSLPLFPLSHPSQAYNESSSVSLIPNDSSVDCL